MRLAVYPGSFDPMTNGHVDVIRRASAVFDRLVVAVLANPRKTPLLPVDTRIGIIRAALEAERIDAERFEVASFDGLTVDFCRARGATAIVRGLRAISDFDSEMQLAHNNRVLAPDVDSVFFMTSVENGFVSSSLVKEIASFGGDVSSMVPAAAAEALASAPATRFRPKRPRVIGGRRPSRPCECQRIGTCSDGRQSGQNRDRPVTGRAFIPGLMDGQATAVVLEARQVDRAALGHRCQTRTQSIGRTTAATVRGQHRAPDAVPFSRERPRFRQGPRRLDHATQSPGAGFGSAARAPTRLGVTRRVR